MKVLVACEESQAVTIELRKLGHEAYSCDIQECSGGHLEWHVCGDVLGILNPIEVQIDGKSYKSIPEFTTMDGKEHLIMGRWDMIIAFPPCTHLCSSGQRWFYEGKKDPVLREEAKAFFMRFANADCERIAIENPVGIMSTHFRKPNQVVQPWMFGDTDNKKTCLWLKGLPNIVSTDIVPVDKRTNNNWRAVFGGKHYSWNDPIVAKLRSKTYPGLAKAMAEQWANAGGSTWTKQT